MTAPKCAPESFAARCAYRVQLNSFSEAGSGCWWLVLPLANGKRMQMQMLTLVAPGLAQGAAFALAHAATASTSRTLAAAGTLLLLALLVALEARVLHQGLIVDKLWAQDPIAAKKLGLRHCWVPCQNLPRQTSNDENRSKAFRERWGFLFIQLRAPEGDSERVPRMTWAWAHLFHVPVRLACGVSSAMVLGAFVRSVPRCHRAHPHAHDYAQLTLLVAVTGLQVCWIWAVHPVEARARHLLLLTDACAQWLSMLCGLLMAFELRVAAYGLIGFQVLNAGVQMLRAIVVLVQLFRNALRSDGGQKMMQVLQQELEVFDQRGKSFLKRRSKILSFVSRNTDSVEDNCLLDKSGGQNRDVESRESVQHGSAGCSVPEQIHKRIGSNPIEKIDKIVINPLASFHRSAASPPAATQRLSSKLARVESNTPRDSESAASEPPSSEQTILTSIAAKKAMLGNIPLGPRPAAKPARTEVAATSEEATTKAVAPKLVLTAAATETAPPATAPAPVSRTTGRPKAPHMSPSIPPAGRKQSSALSASVEESTPDMLTNPSRAMPPKRRPPTRRKK
ncbi:hypothetical protein CYMTET_36597 [Cymbomonas tetramitiformis]|uniref:Uncharacterized protein n=1 Tax=Cymbomonas tetramitiformis TaxID=36881 RepID=A0AAE0F730_9CHLO|nr:hypothetical protein CYMTET_36597 [Cymbomonas tetramitiformis]